jgi:hypothetical protein
MMQGDWRTMSDFGFLRAVWGKLCPRVGKMGKKTPTPPFSEGDMTGQTIWDGRKS